MCGDSGGALVLLLIVTIFQNGACNGITTKFGVLLVLSAVKKIARLSPVLSWKFG
jgi:hypothetical protein